LGNCEEAEGAEAFVEKRWWRAVARRRRHDAGDIGGSAAGSGDEVGVTRRNLFSFDGDSLTLTGASDDFYKLIYKKTDMFEDQFS
jgi:hypothetical protein